MLAILRLILFPRFMVPAEPDAGRGVANLERIQVPSDKGAVEAWLLPGYGTSPARPGPAVIFAHGNGELIDHWPEMLEPYRRMGLTVLLPEYRGYGRTPGSPSQAAITRDYVRCYDLLAARAEVDAERIVFHGRSLGGGVLCALATRRAPAALILMSTFTSVVAMARRYFVPRFLVPDPFDNLAVVAVLSCPVLIVHGEQDRLIPLSHAKELCAAAPRATLLTYPRADHNDCPPDWAAFFVEVRRFLERARIIE